MATKKIAQGARATKKRAEMPVSEGRCALSEINMLVWKLRWELEMTAGHAVALADVESEAAE